MRKTLPFPATLNPLTSQGAPEALALPGGRGGQIPQGRLRLKLAALCCLPLPLAGCNWFGTDDNPYKSTTVQEFAAARDAKDCAAGAKLEFSGVDVIGPNADGTYTMTQTGTPEPKIYFNMNEAAAKDEMGGGEVSSVHTVRATIGQSCILTITSMQ